MDRKLDRKLSRKPDCKPGCKRIIASALAAALALTASVASADPRGQRDHRDGPPRAERPHQRQPVVRQPVVIHNHYRAVPVVRQVRVPVPYHRFHRGDRLPRDYGRPYYVVDHWQRHRLAPPPPHHHWVQVGADYLLVAIASGIVAQVVLGH